MSRSRQKGIIQGRILCQPLLGFFLLLRGAFLTGFFLRVLAGISGQPLKLKIEE